MIEATTEKQHQVQNDFVDVEDRILINFSWNSIINKTDEKEKLSMEPMQKDQNVYLDSMNEKQAGKILDKFLKQVKRTMKQKISLYEPLTFKTAYKNFLIRLKDDRFKVIRDIMDNGDLEEYVNRIVKDFLIENAYYEMEEKHIRQRVGKKFWPLDHNDMKVLKTIDFIIDGIERNGMKRIKTFGEKSKFKTFFFTVVSSLYYDSFRKSYSDDKNVERYDADLERLFPDKTEGNMDKLYVQVEDEKARERAAEILPHVLNELSPEELTVIKLKYEKNTPVSAIARTLGLTRFKTDQYIKKIEKKISMDILNRINYPQSDDRKRSGRKK